MNPYGLSGCFAFRLPRLIASFALGVLVLGLSPLAARAQTEDWTWMSGGLLANDAGVYGTKGVADPANVPGVRTNPVTWTDSAGNLWLFGGNGFATVAAGSIHFNDLWKFSPATNEWTWVSGADNGAPGVYGTLGVAAPGNVPGSREAGVGWTDANGNLWLFGGWGYDSAGTFGVLNDLWEFNIQTGEWTWLGGNSTLPNATDTCWPGVYGTLGAAAAGNLPGGRQLAVSWTDLNGNLWLFGGSGCDANGNQLLLNDLWKFSPSAKQWAWISGGNTNEQLGVYGTAGATAAGNVPGSRWNATAWSDHQGNLWLFGGNGIDSNGSQGYLNDLWEFNPSTTDWTWMGGSSVLGTANCYQAGIECAPTGVYGTLGQAAAANVPGGRNAATGSIDSKGNLWLFGGANNANGVVNLMNDLWEFTPATSQWAWMGGSNTITCGAKDAQGVCVVDGVAGVYGTLLTPAAGNVPGSRSGEVSWTDKSGKFWLFGGDGFDSASTLGLLNDLWEYQTPPPPPSFTLGASPTSITITSGGPGAITLTVTPQNGFNSAVSFACSGLPVGVTCGFNPATVTPTGNSAITTQLNLTASATPALRASQGPVLPVAALAVVIGLFGLKRRKGAWLAVWVIAAGVGLAMVSGCGGGSPAVKTPPPVTATVTVTATSGSLQQSTTIALTVK